MIRAATIEDVGVIAYMIRALAVFERLTHVVTFDETELAAYLFGPKPYAEVLLAESHGSPVGFALFFHTFSTFAGRPGMYLEDLYVEPAQRGHGYGKELFLAVARLAAERRCARMEWSVLPWNTAAIAFYTAMGALPIYDWQLFRLSGTELSRIGPN